MCITGSKANATSAVIEFSFLRTTYFITRSVYVHLYFPENHFGLLYGKFNSFREKRQLLEIQNFKYFDAKLRFAHLASF